jgi:hypothetical protein
MRQTRKISNSARSDLTQLGTVGQYALHVSCPWRITGPFGIVTGSSDRHKSPNSGELIGEEDWAGGDLQAKKLSDFVRGLRLETRSILMVERSKQISTVESS